MPTVPAPNSNDSGEQGELAGFHAEAVESSPPTPMATAAREPPAASTFGNSGDAPLFDMMYVDPEDCDTGPLSTPNAEDFPIGAHVRLHDIERCQRAMGDAWLSWMPALCNEGVTVRVVRHLTDHTVIDLHMCPSTWGLPAAPACPSTRSPSPTSPLRDNGASEHSSRNGRIYTRVTLNRACLVGPRLSNADRDRYGTPPQASKTSTDSPQVIGGRPQSGRLDGVQSSDSLGIVQTQNELGPNALSITLPPGVSLATIKSIRERGNQQYRDRMVDAAVDTYSEAIGIIVANPELHRSREHVRNLSCRSAAYMQLRKLDEALEDAQQIINLAPDSIDGFVRAGDIMRRKRQHQAADEYYKQALVIRPDEDRLKKQREANALAAVLTQSMPPFTDMVVDPSHISVVSKRRVARGNRVFTEAPVSSVPITIEDGGGSATPSCSHCHTLCVDKKTIMSMISVAPTPSSRAVECCNAILTSMGASSFSGTPAVNCGHHCGAAYCSERCRSAAWEEYHWAECSTTGTWARATTELARVLAPSTANARVLKPHLVWLTYRLIAVFVKKHGLAFDEKTFRLNFSCRCSALATELSVTQTAVAERVYEVLTRGWPEELTQRVSKEAFFEALEYVTNSALVFGVTPFVRIEDAVVSHIGLLQDRRGLGDDNAAVQHIAALEELRERLPGVAVQMQLRCIGAFRVIGSCRRSEDPRFASFGDAMETSTFVPRPFSPSPSVPSVSPVGTLSGLDPAKGPDPARAGATAAMSSSARRQSSSGRQATANAIVTAMSPSATVGVGVVALTDLPSMSALILDVPQTVSARSTPNGSMASRGTTATFSSVGSHQSIANMVPMPSGSYDPKPPTPTAREKHASFAPQV